MQRIKSGWKKPAIIFLTLLLLAEIGDVVRLRYFDSALHLPVLMYHHFAEECPDGTVVTPERFREQMTALRDAGYHTVTTAQVVAYVREGAPLPEKPVLITMDDGYTSNLTVAAPILEELGMCATVFVIGIFEGRAYDPNTGWPITPMSHFSYPEALPWVEKGVIDLQSHSFNLHPLASDTFHGRKGMLRMKGESGEDYRQALLDDDALARQQREEDGIAAGLNALAFPFGYYDMELDGVLKEAGYAATFTIDERINRLNVGDESGLRMMGRFNVTDRVSGGELVDRLDRYSNNVRNK